MADTYIKISELEETTLADDSSFIPIDNGNHTYKISVENYNSGANATAQSYAEAAAASADDAETAKTAAETAETETGLIRTATQQYATAASGSASAAASSAVDALNYADSAASAAANAADSAQDAAESYTNAAEKAVLSESWAVGGTNTRTGEDTNNSQYYAAVAKSAAENAEDQVELANSASQAASGSAVDAAASATEASGYADDASDYATAASGSATAAAGSATQSANSAGAAATSATNAAASATAASGSASTATTQANNAAQSATTAGGYATQAASSASDASGYATNAANSATAAAGSATTASNQATAAAASATEASGYADDAADSAADAAESAATFTTDDTLSIAGKAADAKAAGDMIAAVQAEIPELDNWLTTPGAAAEAKHTGDRITEVEDDVTALKSALNMIETPQIVGMTDTGISTVSSNLFQYATMIGYHKAIYSLSGGKVVLTDATSSNTYLIPVDGVSTYTFTFCRSAVVVSDADLTAVGSILNHVQSVNSEGGKYIVFSFNTGTYPESSYEVTKTIDKYKVPKNWDFGDATIQTPQIFGMLPTGKTVESSNLFSTASLVASSKYIDRITNGKAVLADSANLDTYIIPVDGESTYTFTNCRTAVVVSDLEYTAVGELLSYATSIDSAGGKYILFSFNRNTYPPGSYVVTYPVAQYTIPADWNLQRDHKNQYQINTGSIADGGSLALTGKTAVKFGQRIVFKGVITSFSRIKLAFYNYNNSSVINSIIVDSTNLYVYSGTTAVQTWVHGLTIMHDISLIVDYLKDNVQISLESNGTIYKNTATFYNLTSGVVSVSAVSTGTVCSSAILLMAIPEALKPIWYFGDSYISHTNQARWTYYLLDYGFDKGTLLNGYAGGTSAASVMALTALLGYGTPKFAVFATGMNDGSDSASAPSTSWVNARNNFISLCESNGIEPIFATVPTVPSVDNEQKNAWVKSSGYRYIDFAKAVGADGTGAWYSGMLSTDNVHPTEKGAIALFTQAISDFPEFVAE